MTHHPEHSSESAPIHLHVRAADNLRFIRETMEGASRFTGLSGKGYVLIGCSAFLAAWLAVSQTSLFAWLMIWFAEFVLAVVIGLGFTVRKTIDQGIPLWSRSARKLLLAFSPTMAVGGLLTVVLFPHGDAELIQGVWLSLYGASVVTGGLFSVRIVPVMGFAFMALGALALLWPASAGWMMLLGFGGVHLLFGTFIWRWHGG